MTRLRCYTTAMRSAARVGAAVLVLAVVPAACSSSAPRPSTTSSPSGAPTSFAELAALIITKVPAGFALQPDSVGDTGPSTLEKAINDDGAADAASVLRSEGFVRGYQRLWIGPEDAQIVVFIYQFETPAGARRAHERDRKNYASELPPGAHVKQFATPGFPTGTALGIAGADSTGAAGIVFFTTDVFDVQINCNTQKPEQLQARALAIAQDQLGRLNS